MKTRSRQRNRSKTRRNAGMVGSGEIKSLTQILSEGKRNSIQTIIEKGKKRLVQPDKWASKVGRRHSVKDLMSSHRSIQKGAKRTWVAKTSSNKIVLSSWQARVRASRNYSVSSNNSQIMRNQVASGQASIQKKSRIQKTSVNQTKTSHVPMKSIDRIKSKSSNMVIPIRKSIPKKIVRKSRG